MKSGTQARDGTARSAWSVGSRIWRAVGSAPVKAPAAMPARAPKAKPRATRTSVAWTCIHRSPEAARSWRVAAIRLGGGISRPWARPVRTANSHPITRARGRIRPSARRPPRCQKVSPRGLGDAVPSAASCAADTTEAVAAGSITARSVAADSFTDQRAAGANCGSISPSTAAFTSVPAGITPACCKAMPAAVIDSA